MTSNTSKTELPIECRVSPWWWLMVPMMLGMGAFMALGAPSATPKSPNSPGSDWPIIILGGGIGLFFGVASFWMALDLIYGFIRADEQGLSWRRPFTGLRSARWDEITDYYWSSANVRVVSTRAGKVALDTHLRNYRQLAALVIEKTPHIDNIGWERSKTRSKENWSRTFTPWSAEQKWIPPFILICPFGLSLNWIFGSGKWPNRNLPSTGFWLDTLPLILAIIFGGLILFGYLVALRHSLREWIFAFKHRDEKLTLNAQGLFFSSQNQRFEAKWSEIQQITKLPKIDGFAPVQVETASEKCIIWNIVDNTMWQRIESLLKQYAAHAVDAEFERFEETILLATDMEGERGAWKDGAVGAGTPRWSYRTRLNRLALQTVSGFLFFVPFMNLIRSYTKSEDGQMHVSCPLLGGMYLVVALIVGLIWLWYYRAEILAEETGLQIRSPFHRTHQVAWHEIESISADSMGEFVQAKGEKFYFARLLKPVRVQELRDYIDQQRSS